MESLWDWLVSVHGTEVGRASGDETLLEALFEAAEGALASGTLRPAVVVAGCQADPTSLSRERVDRLASAASAVCVVSCSPSCGAPTYATGDFRVDALMLPTLHQTDTGPSLVAHDRRSGFGLTIAARRLDLPQSPWRTAKYEVAWSLSADVALATMRWLGARAQSYAFDRLPRVFVPVEEPAVAFAGRTRARSRSKPGARSGTATLGRADDGTTGRDLTLALASRFLSELQGAAAFEGALTSIAASGERARGADEQLDMIAGEVGRVLDASRVSIVLTTPRSGGDSDDAPTTSLTKIEEAKQGIYTRVDTRRLDTVRFDRMENPALVARLAVPVMRDGAQVGEIRSFDTRPARVWTATERRFVERAAALVSVSLLRRPPGERAENELEATDELTGLEPRAIFERRLEAVVSAAGRLGENVSLVRLKIERLSDINETHGYAVGDAVIRHVASALRGRLVDDEDSSLARFGGEGFAVLLPGFTQLAATRVAELLATSVSALPLPPVGTVTALVGVATYPGCAATAEGLAAVARARMLGGL